MGAGAACVFRWRRISRHDAARGRDKAASGLTEVQNDARAEAIESESRSAAYEADLGKTLRKLD